MQDNNATFLKQFRVDAKDRKYQIWERKSLSVPLWTEAVVEQKLRYIHENPVRAGLCKDIVDFEHSSAAFYETGVDSRGVITHYKYDF